MNTDGAPLAESDPEVCTALEQERERQAAQIELIASENIVSGAVREALGHEINNKTLEGYPGRRFHGGGQNVDTIENLAIERARKLFGAEYVNVQPHSGTQANQAVFFALTPPRSRISQHEPCGGRASEPRGARERVGPLVRRPSLRRRSRDRPAGLRRRRGHGPRGPPGAADRRRVGVPAHHRLRDDGGYRGTGRCASGGRYGACRGPRRGGRSSVTRAPTRTSSAAPPPRRCADPAAA